MAQGIYIETRGFWGRPRSKKQIKETFQQDPERVVLEVTSVIAGTEHGGPVAELPEGVYYFVGPDPYRDRKFYGQIIVRADGKVTIK